MKAVLIVLLVFMVIALATSGYCIFAMGSICSNKEDAEYADHMARKKEQTARGCHNAEALDHCRQPAAAGSQPAPASLGS